MKPNNFFDNDYFKSEFFQSAFWELPYFKTDFFHGIGNAPTAAKATSPAKETPKTEAELQAMSVTELQAYAKHRGITLSTNDKTLMIDILKA